jgi:hypothetical protein
VLVQHRPRCGDAAPAAGAGEQILDRPQVEHDLDLGLVAGTLGLAVIGDGGQSEQGQRDLGARDAVDDPSPDAPSAHSDRPGRLQSHALGPTARSPRSASANRAGWSATPRPNGGSAARPARRRAPPAIQRPRTPSERRPSA